MRQKNAFRTGKDSLNCGHITSRSQGSRLEITVRKLMIFTEDLLMKGQALSARILIEVRKCAPGIHIIEQFGGTMANVAVARSPRPIKPSYENTSTICIKSLNYDDVPHCEPPFLSPVVVHYPAKPFAGCFSRRK